MKKLLAFVFGWCLIITTIIFSIHAIALRPEFYLSRYERMDLAQEIHTRDQDLEASIHTLMDYLEDKTDSLQGTIVWKGRSQDMFNKREREHMVDVKNLYQNAMKVAFICGALAIGILFYFIYFYRKQALHNLSLGILQAGVCFTMCLFVLGFWIFIDFTSFWTWFHTLFFRNDLWLLNPQTDFMICMLPETIFSQLVISIVVMILCILIPIYLFCLYVHRKKGWYALCV